MTEKDYKEIYQSWVRAWNEEDSIVDNITEPNCIVYQARTDGKSSGEQRGPAALKSLISDGKAFFDEAKMEIEIGPIVEAPYVTARWKFSGIYNGTMPGAKAEAGKEVSFCGTDIFLIERGRIQAYWISSDGVHLMEQLGLFG